MRRYLITTADERSWKFDRPVLFLGEWCRLYNRKHIWSAMDAEVMEPYGLQIEQRERDFACVRALSNQLLEELTCFLNAFHAIKHSARFWNVVLGHWLQVFVATVFNRYVAIEKALNEHEIAGTTVLESRDDCLITPDLSNFVRACDNDIWNHILYARILDFLNFKKVEIIQSDLSCSHVSRIESIRTLSLRKRIKRVVKAVANAILPYLSKKRDAFIFNSYLPRWQQIRLQIILG